MKKFSLILILIVILLCSCSATTEKSTESYSLNTKSYSLLTDNFILVGSNDMAETIYYLTFTNDGENIFMSSDLKGENIKYYNYATENDIAYFSCSQNFLLLLEVQSIDYENIESIYIIRKLNLDFESIEETKIDIQGDILHISIDDFGVLLNTTEYFYIFNPELEIINALKLNITDALWGGEVIVFIENNGKSCYLSYYDPLTNETKQCIKLSTELNLVGSFLGFDICLYDTQSIYGFNFDMNEFILISDWNDCDIAGSSIDQLLVLSSDELCILSCVDKKLSIIKRDNNSTEKIFLVLGLYSEDNSWIEKMVSTFNLNNEYYRISILNYRNVSGGLSQLFTELIAGKGPDIIYLRDLPYESLCDAGALENLYPYIDGDQTLSRDDLYEIFSLLERNGALYSVFAGFTISTIVVDDYTGSGWTIDDFVDYMTKNDIQLTNDTKEDLLALMITFGSHNFVNYDTNTAMFDNDSFIALLEYCNTLPDEVNYSAYNSDRVSFITLTDFYDMQYYESIYIDPVYIGYPSSEQGKPFMSPTLNMGISSSSKFKDVAWSFIRTLLTYDYQINTELYAFPSNIDAFQENLIEAQTPEYYTDEDGIIQESRKGGIGFFNEEDMVVYEFYAATEKQIRSMLDIIENVDTFKSPDEQFVDIVLDDARSYFNGSKTAKEVSEITQSRIQTYISEQE